MTNARPTHGQLAKLKTAVANLSKTSVFIWSVCAAPIGRSCVSWRQLFVIAWAVWAGPLASSRRLALEPQGFHRPPHSAQCTRVPSAGLKPS